MWLYRGSRRVLWLSGNRAFCVFWGCAGVLRGLWMGVRFGVYMASAMLMFFARGSGRSSGLCIGIYSWVYKSRGLQFH